MKDHKTPNYIRQKQRKKFVYSPLLSPQQKGVPFQKREEQ
jgi:hypothetical protein